MLKIPVGHGCTFDGLKVFWTTLYPEDFGYSNWYAKSAVVLQLSARPCSFH